MYVWNTSILQVFLLLFNLFQIFLIGEAKRNDYNTALFLQDVIAKEQNDNLIWYNFICDDRHDAISRAKFTQLDDWPIFERRQSNIGLLSDNLFFHVEAFEKNSVKFCSIVNNQTIDNDSNEESNEDESGKRDVGIDLGTCNCSKDLACIKSCVLGHLYNIDSLLIVIINNEISMELLPFHYFPLQTEIIHLKNFEEDEGDIYASKAFQFFQEEDNWIQYLNGSNDISKSEVVHRLLVGSLAAINQPLSLSAKDSISNRPSIRQNHNYKKYFRPPSTKKRTEKYRIQAGFGKEDGFEDNEKIKENYSDKKYSDDSKVQSKNIEFLNYDSYLEVEAKKNSKKEKDNLYRDYTTTILQGVASLNPLNYLPQQVSDFRLSDLKSSIVGSYDNVRERRRQRKLRDISINIEMEPYCTRNVIEIGRDMINGELPEHAFYAFESIIYNTFPGNEDDILEGAQVLTSINEYKLVENNCIKLSKFYVPSDYIPSSGIRIDKNQLILREDFEPSLLIDAPKFSKLGDFGDFFLHTTAAIEQEQQIYAYLWEERLGIFQKRVSLSIGKATGVDANTIRGRGRWSPLSVFPKVFKFNLEKLPIGGEKPVEVMEIKPSIIIESDPSDSFDEEPSMTLIQETTETGKSIDMDTISYFANDPEIDSENEIEDEKPLKKRNPVFLVNGVLGAALECKLTNLKSKYPHCESNSDWFIIWLAARRLIPKNFKCLLEYMTVNYDPQSGMYSSLPGVEVRTIGFGTTRGMEYVNPDLKLPLLNYFNKLANWLRKAGYEDGKNLFGLPYDWRLPPDGLEQVGYFKAVKAEIELQYRKNLLKPVNVIAHSMGGLIFLEFLKRQNLIWKKTHINSFITLSTPWGGSIQALQAVISGTKLGVPGVQEQYFRSLIQKLPASIWLIPQESVFKNNIVVKTPNKEYRARDFDRLFLDMGEQNSYELYRNLKKTSALMEMPKPEVDTFIIYGYGRPTKSCLIYEEDFQSRSQIVSPETIIYGDPGDGTVSYYSSTRPIYQWFSSWSLTKEKILHFPIYGANHWNILNQPKTLNILREILENKATSIFSSFRNLDLTEKKSSI